jgi:AraC family transcriptional regulator
MLDWWGARVPQLPLAENAMERVLLLARLAATRQQPTITDERIARIITHISERLDGEFSIGELARVAGLSVSRFSCLFKERTGLAPVKFLETRRIERARHLLLTTDLPVQQVGLQVGFPNAQHFSTRFRKLTGQSPRAFRAAPRRRFGELHPREE